MRTLDNDLIAAQQKGSLEPLIKITLTHGEDTVVLELDRLKKLNHIEEPYRANAREVEFDNSDGYFTDKDFKGYKAVISYGLVTASGKKYSDTAPLWVIWQQLYSAQGKLTCQLTMVGIPDLLDEDDASESYIPTEADTKTVKTLLTQIITATLACYNHCQAYEVVFDSEDSLIDSYRPKDGFRIYTGGSRLAAIKRLLDYTKCVSRYCNDGKVHILQPTISGESYDYQYSLESGHTFFSKAYRKTLVIPNYIVVKSNADDDPQYSGFASDAEAYALMPKRQYKATRLQSNAQATSIAEAVLARYQLDAEMGSADVPMNCGAEIFDYIKVTDQREDDYRIGNIGSITRKYLPGKYTMNFSIGDPPGVQYIKELYQTIKREAERRGSSFQRLYAKHAYIEHLSIDEINAEWLDPDSNIDLSKIGDNLDNLPDGEVYGRVKTLHIDAGQIKLDENVFYASGYDPTTKMAGDADLDDIPNGATYSRVLTTDIQAGHIKLSSVEQSTGYRTVTDTEKGSWNNKPDNMDEIGEGSTYKKLLSTDIYAGHIKLTSSVSASGTWYNYGSVEINASTGIKIKGSSCLSFQQAGYSSSWIGPAGNKLRLQPYSDCEVTGDMNPTYSGGTYDLGNTTYYWGHLYHGGITQRDGSSNILADILPYNSSRYIGYSGNRWAKAYFVDLVVTNPPWAESYNDLALIKAMRPRSDDPTLIDMETVADWLRESKDEQRERFTSDYAEEKHRIAERKKDKDLTAKELQALEEEDIALDVEHQGRISRLENAPRDGISLSASVGLIFGAIRELTGRLEALESRL